MGCCGTVENITHNLKFNHRAEVEFGVEEDKCREIIQNFFKELRKK